MQVNSMLKATTAALALILVGSASQAVTRTWDGDVDTDFNLAANWSSNTLPTSSDTARIVLPGNNRLPVLSANITVGALNVQQNASVTTDVYALTVINSAGLNVDANGSVVVSRQVASPFNPGTLKLTGGGNHPIDGLVDVQGIMWVDSNNATMQGSGTIRLNNALASMDISNGLTATIKMRVEGQGTIQPASGGATFVLYADSTYNGVVDANVSGTLAFAASLTVDDTSVGGVRPLFRAGTSASAILAFNQDALSLVGNFAIDDCATIDLNASSIYTSGSLLLFEGHIIVDNGETFELNGSADLFPGPATYNAGGC